VTAVASFCRELSEEHGVEVEFHPESVPRQQNALRHSGSKHFEVRLKGTPNEIELTVRDSGVGFDREEAMTGHGLGLTSMNERIKPVHGKLSVDSHLAERTIIRATVPLNLGATKAAHAGT